MTQRAFPGIFLRLVTKRSLRFFSAQPLKLGAPFSEDVPFRTTSFHQILKMISVFESSKKGLLSIDRDQPRISASLYLEIKASKSDGDLFMDCDELNPFFFLHFEKY